MQDLTGLEYGPFKIEGTLLGCGGSLLCIDAQDLYRRALRGQGTPDYARDAAIQNVSA